MKINLLFCIFISFIINVKEATSAVDNSESAGFSDIDTTSGTEPMGQTNYNFEEHHDYDFDFKTVRISGITPKPTPNNWTSKASVNTFASSPGCPKPHNGAPWLYYGNPRKCYLSGDSHACPGGSGSNMKFRPQQSSLYGYCDCNCENLDQSTKTHTSQRFCLGKTSEGKYRVLAYRKELRSCQPLFEQSGCAEGEWLVMGTDPLEGPICEPRRCPLVQSDNRDSVSYYDYRSGSCHVVGEPCETSYALRNQCQTVYASKEAAQWSSQDWVPVCTEAGAPGGASGGASYLGVSTPACFQGEHYDFVMEQCIPDSKVDVSDDVG